MDSKYKNFANIQSLRDAVLEDAAMNKMSDKEILYPVLLQLLALINPDNDFPADKIAEKILHLIKRENERC